MPNIFFPKKALCMKELKFLMFQRAIIITSTHPQFLQTEAHFLLDYIPFNKEKLFIGLV